MIRLLSTKRGWIAANAIWCTAVSLIAATVTGNPNWPLNIVVCLPVGALIGWCGWRLHERTKVGAR